MPLIFPKPRKVKPTTALSSAGEGVSRPYTWPSQAENANGVMFFSTSRQHHDFS
jgi:hypothetical protein